MALRMRSSFAAAGPACCQAPAGTQQRRAYSVVLCTLSHERRTCNRAPAGRAVTQVAAGQEHSLALGAGGEVWAWGNGAYGQLGLGPGTWLSCEAV